MCSPMGAKRLSEQKDIVLGIEAIVHNLTQKRQEICFLKILYISAVSFITTKRAVLILHKKLIYKFYL